MKMEIGFDAPVSGVVKEVRARRGQQVAAGELLLVIEPAADGSPAATVPRRLELIRVPDRLAPLFANTDSGISDLASADAAPEGEAWVTGRVLGTRSKAALGTVPENCVPEA